MDQGVGLPVSPGGVARMLNESAGDQGRRERPARPSELRRQIVYNGTNFKSGMRRESRSLLVPMA